MSWGLEFLIWWCGNGGGPKRLVDAEIRDRGRRREDQAHETRHGGIDDVGGRWISGDLFVRLRERRAERERTGARGCAARRYCCCSRAGFRCAARGSDWRF